ATPFPRSYRATVCWPRGVASAGSPPAGARAPSCACWRRRASTWSSRRSSTCRRVPHLSTVPDVSTHPLLDVLLAGHARAERLTASRTFQERAAEHTDWPRWADATVVQGYRRLGVERPWTHQAVAADLVHRGRHTALATSTGSGKSLAFWLPALSAVREATAAATLDPGNIASARTRPTTLYLSPTKALAADQLNALDRVLDAAGTR